MTEYVVCRIREGEKTEYYRGGDTIEAAKRRKRIEYERHYGSKLKEFVIVQRPEGMLKYDFLKNVDKYIVKGKKEK